MTTKISAITLSLLCASIFACKPPAASFAGKSAAAAPKASASPKANSALPTPASQTNPPPQAAAATRTQPTPETSEAEATFTDRLTQHGAQTGAIQISLVWDNDNDLDLHVFNPLREHVYYDKTNDSIGGFLDVDMNAYHRDNPASDEISKTPVENVFWNEAQAKHGHYKIFVYNFHKRTGQDPTPFRLRLKIGAKTEFFSGSAKTHIPTLIEALFPPSSDELPQEAVMVHEFDY